MVTAKTKIRKTLLILLCMILVYSCAGHSFLGPGISQAATTLGTITATDVVSPIGGQAEPMADATAYKVNNVLMRVALKTNDFTYADFQVNGTTAPILHKYKKGSISVEELYDGFWERWDTHRQAGFAVFSSEYEVNTHLIDFCFNVPFTQEDPINTLTFQESWSSNSQNIESIFDYKVYLMGDANGDGDIDAEDTLAIMKDAVGTLDPPLSAEQRVAADVNFDGQVNA